MASTAQQPAQGGDPSTTTDAPEQSSYQPAPSQTSTYDSEDIGFDILNASSDDIMNAILSELKRSTESSHGAAATNMQQPSSWSTLESTNHTNSSSSDQQKQRPEKRLNNSDMIKSFLAKDNTLHETHQRQPTSPIAQSRKRKLDEPAVACPAQVSLEQHPHKFQKTGSADMLTASAFDLSQSLTPGYSYASQNKLKSGSSQENPLVLDDDDGITAQQYDLLSSYPIAKPTLPETTNRAVSTYSSSSAVAFAVEETIPLPTIGGHAHRTFAFSPACQISIRRGGQLLSLKKGEQVLHFTSSSITKNHTGDEKLDETGSRVHNKAAAEPDGEPCGTSRFKVVGFGPCRRCQMATAALGGQPRLCDRGHPCGSCLAEAGGDAGVAMRKCHLPVVAKPDGAIDGDELLKRDVKVVRPGMTVLVEQVKTVKGSGVGERGE